MTTITSTSYPDAEKHRKALISDRPIEIIDDGELEFDLLIKRHKKTLLSDRYKGYESIKDGLNTQTPNATNS